MVVARHAFLGEGTDDATGAVYAGTTPFPGYPSHFSKRIPLL